MYETLIPRLADWAGALAWNDLPDTVRRLARAQLAGWLGSLAAGRVSDDAPGLLAVAQMLGGPGEACVWPSSSRRLGAWGAIYASAALSCAHDYDDYMYLAHTGHSACAVSWTYAQLYDRPVRDVLLSMVAANEVMGRLGAACLVGPQNGQLWTFIHLAGGAICAVRLSGGEAPLLQRALSLAFFQPPFALWPGFGAASSKLLSAATPTLLGVMAAAHAEQGLAGSADVLDGRGGFFERFSFLPLASVFEDLEDAFATHTLSVKPWPGCAYVTAAAEAALGCVEKHADKAERPFAPDEIERVDVSAGPLTIGMQRLLGHHCRQPPYSPIGVNFSVPLTVALALLHGRLDVDDLTGASLGAHAEMLRSLADKVHLTVDTASTGQLLGALGRGANLWSHLRRHSRSRLLAGIAQALRAATPGGDASSPLEGLGPRQAVALLTSLRQLWRGPSDGAPYHFAFPFGASVRVTTASGSFAHRVEIPRGAAGHGAEEIAAVAREKCVRETGRFVEPEVVEKWADAIVGGEADGVSVGEIVASVGEGWRPLS